MAKSCTVSIHLSIWNIELCHLCLRILYSVDATTITTDISRSRTKISKRRDKSAYLEFIVVCYLEQTVHLLLPLFVLTSDDSFRKMILIMQLCSVSRG